jgi:hypothetical protein
MISDSRTDANRKVLVKRVGEHLLPSAQPLGLGRSCPPVTTPGTGNRHIDLLCYLWPGQALVPELQDLLCRSGVSLRTTGTHSDASPLELLADSAPMNAQLGIDLAEGPTLGVQVGCMLNIHRTTVAAGLTWQRVDIDDHTPRPFRLAAWNATYPDGPDALPGVPAMSHPSVGRTPRGWNADPIYSTLTVHLPSAWSCKKPGPEPITLSPEYFPISLTKFSEPSSL